LFCELMLWGRAQGFDWFNLGVAPLYGVESDETSAALWRHAARLLARHGEHFYNFEGLQRYKAKFQPVWTMLYLASPAGLALPQVLLDVATLTAGGVLGIVAKGQTPTPKAAPANS
jgi:phosphatidylglycerol lysyltransferase